MDIRRYDDDTTRTESMDAFEGMQRLFERMGRPFEGRMDTDAAVDLLREDDRFVFVMDLPGFEREDIELTYGDGHLSVAAEWSETDEYEGRRGRRTRHVDRQLRIPGEIDVEAIEASYRNGVLEVLLPLADVDDAGHEIDIQG